ncbi:MAG: hypothetical protein UW24_C0026G0008 [Parcubacteria group bacterium GW2011_GWA2_44_12]|nr:MAG: hypothetical protein UW24_C0026G0008 [Parcubacteria group bacterium GW2011_GWA2_44_12]
MYENAQEIFDYLPIRRNMGPIIELKVEAVLNTI